jgi:hypothetical protein
MTIFFVALLTSYGNYEHKLTLRDFGEVNVSTKSVDSTSVTVVAPGDCQQSLPLKSCPVCCSIQYRDLLFFPVPCYP